MWQHANGRAISSSGLREGALARDWARRFVARSMREGGRVVAVGTIRFNVRWIEADVDAMVCLDLLCGLVDHRGNVGSETCEGDAKAYTSLMRRHVTTKTT